MRLADCSEPAASTVVRFFCTVSARNETRIYQKLSFVLFFLFFLFSGYCYLKKLTSDHAPLAHI